jgi:hypothetical protein
MSGWLSQYDDANHYQKQSDVLSFGLSASGDSAFSCGLAKMRLDNKVTHRLSALFFSAGTIGARFEILWPDNHQPIGKTVFVTFD